MQTTAKFFEIFWGVPSAFFETSLDYSMLIVRRIEVGAPAFQRNHITKIFILTCRLRETTHYEIPFSFTFPLETKFWSAFSSIFEENTQFWSVFWNPSEQKQRDNAKSIVSKVLCCILFWRPDMDAHKLALKIIQQLFDFSLVRLKSISKNFAMKVKPLFDPSLKSKVMLGWSLVDTVFLDHFLSIIYV